MSSVINPRKDVYQSNSLTASYIPFTALQADIFGVILASLKKDQTEYSMTVKQLGEWCDVSETNWATIRKAVEAMYNISFELPTEKEIDGEMKPYLAKSRLFWRIEYPDQRKLNGIENINKISPNDIFTVFIAPEMISELFNLTKNFTIWELKDYLKLTSLNSKKLYTIFCQYKKTGVLNLDWKDVQDSMGTNYPTLALFKAHVYNPCIKEILKETNVKTIIPHPRKLGRKILNWSFTFSWNKQLKLLNEPPSIDPKIQKVWQRLQKDFKLSARQADKILDQVDITDINNELYEIQIMRVSDQIQANIGGLTYTRFRDKYSVNFDELS